MNNYEKVASSPETLGEFLTSLSIPVGPWDMDFQKQHCANCLYFNCDSCPHEKERNNPVWWLKREAEVNEEEPAKQTTEHMAACNSREITGDLDCMDRAAAVMLHLGNMLSVSDEKIRVTIERDPENGRFTMKREIIT